ncbi:PepSY-associated TM helix domain-containing protein [Hymenobacter cheonanensis]|uniref:PepSY-associated TM helix domain-containing protein n=1 Tax=Hymenobacter sp. CA2-7 TaxID=3063993 RepID=UPI002713ED30|nr:PepSY-associated TM helix domain-containing protein [Hymenobacter sp. CA2-7]MDO7886189.1 PepSY-associated TM helix domain-containing protein [Hymenobacter sp. CA2-7]
MKVFFRRIHLYLALAAGLVFFVQCLSGTVLIFEEEITHALHAERYVVAVPTGQLRQPRLALAQLARQFQQANPKYKVLGFKVYADPARTVELTYRDGKARPVGPRGEGGARGEGRGQEPQGPAGREGRGEGSPGGRGRGGEKGRPERGSTAYLNPYTGQLLGLQTEKQLPVFKFAEDLHRRLLAGEVGKALTGLSALFILVITATGLVLWWPKTRDMLRGRLRIKWGASGKRLTHDLHVVLGFYCSLFLVGLALTGVIMSYRWATEGLFTLTNSRPTVGLLAPVSAQPGSPRQVAYDAALRTGQVTYRTAEYWRVGAPKDSAAAITVSAPSQLPLRSLGLDTLFVDRSTGAALGQHLYARQSAGAQLRRLAKPLHTGEIGGVWTKMLALVVTLCSLTFPVTGVLMWLNRTRKKSGRASRRPVAQPIAG